MVPMSSTGAIVRHRHKPNQASNHGDSTPEPAWSVEGEFVRTIIVGGVAGGMSAAARLRRLDESREIVVLERGDHVSFANCGLPYYVGGVIGRRESLLLQTPAALGARFGIDVRVRHEVIAIDPADQTVTVRALADGTEYTEPYDDLVLSLGASPVVPHIPGVDRALTLRNVSDVDRMVVATDRALEAGRHAVVIGAGFIGIEMAENLRHRGLEVTVVELSPQVLPPLDPELAALVTDELLANGVAVLLETQVRAIGADTVTLADGRILPADLVVMCIGVRPETALAAAAGIRIGPAGGVVVDEHNRTSVEHVYAVGDMVEKHDPVTGEQTLVPLANIANKQGRRVADHIAGRPGPVRSDVAMGTAVVQVFGLTAAVTGANTRRLRAQDRDVLAVHTHPASHAGYYPGASQLHLKLLLDRPSGAILGAQGVGAEGVARRIDVIATAMAGGLKAVDLIDLELAYAPPYGSAKDPVNLLGYVAENALETDATVQWDELDEATTLVDVRTPGEFAAGSIPGAVNIPVDDLRDRHTELPEGPVTVYCQVGQRAHVATRLLCQLGHQASNLDGGWLTWSAGRRARELATRQPVAAAVV